MKCSNAKCGRKIDRPLELYDGRWACPYCRSIIGDTGGNFRITAMSDATFVRSEICFLRWLSSGRDKYGKEGMKLLDRAVSLCKDAALSGHPEAAIRLGYYYDKDFVETNRSETARCRVAYNYYASVCFGRTEGALTVEEGLTAPDWNGLRRKAAGLLLGMLAYTPEEFDAIDTYNFERNRQRAEKTLGISFTMRRASGASESDRVSETLAVLRSCETAGRSPLFGVLGMSGGELKALTQEKAFYPMLSRKRVRLEVFAAGDDGTVSESDRPQPFTNKRLIDKVIGDYEGKKVYLYFFNARGSRQVERALDAGNGRLIKELIAGGEKTSYVFYDDDIAMYDKSGAAKAAGRLIDAVCNRQEAAI